MPKEDKVNRRAQGLTREQIIAAALEILDQAGEEGLTFRSLAAHLQTGAGALYWHIANKEALMAEAADAMLRPLQAPDLHPREAIHALALRLYDLIDAHPWLGGQLMRTPPTLALLRVYELLGSQLRSLAPERLLFTATTVLSSHILTESRQNAANGRAASGADRVQFLQSVAADWAALAPEEFPFVRALAAPLSGHDDRAEFLGGIDLILAGLATQAG